MVQSRGDLQLGIAYWIATHRQQLRTWWAIMLLSFIGLSVVWAAIFYSIFFAEQPGLEKSYADRIQAFAALRPPASLIPVALAPTSVTTIQRDSGHVDLLAFVKNTNANWGALRLQYHFTLGDRALDTKETFINPESERPLIELNVAHTGTAQARLVLDSIDWVRAGTAVIPPPRFSTDKLELTPTSVTVGKAAILTMNLRSDITNRAVYNFLRVEVPIIVMSGSTIIAVDSQSLDRWGTLTARTITSTWSYPIPAADSARVEPQVSQFDTTNLYK